MKIDRRSFLKSAGAGGAYCALAHAIPGTLATLCAAPLEGKEAEVHSICEMCSTRCPISARLINEKNVFIGGNAKSESFGGSVCARGGSGHSLLYDPDRLVKPIMRVGARGEGKWKEITWDEAYSEIASKLLAIKKKHGPEAVVFSSKAGSQHKDLFYMANAFGSPNTFTHISTCPGGPYVAGKAIFGKAPLKLDVGNSRYIVNFGHNLYEGIEMVETRAMMKAQVDKKAKLVVFEPRFSIVADKADEWFAIKPGTDVAVALAMCHVLIKDKLVDLNFVERYVDGYDEFAAEVQKYTPEWAEKISDVKARDIIRITHELASHAPHALVDFGHRSTFTTEEFELRRALFAINVLMGNIEKEGGLFFGVNAKKYNELAGESVAPELANPNLKLPKISAKRIDLVDKQFSMIGALGGIYQSVLDAALESKPYPLKGWIITRSNPMQTMTDRTKVEKVLKGMELVVVCDVYISETASMADIVLPESTYLEREEAIFDYSAKVPSYSIRQPVVKTIGDTKPCWKIWRELAIKMGLGEYYKWENMVDFQLAQLKGDKFEFARLKQEGWLEYGEAPLLLREEKMVGAFSNKYLHARVPDSDGTYTSALTFDTPSGKIELSSARIEEMAPGRGVIRYREVKLKKEDELFFIQGKVAVHTNGATHNIPFLNNLMPDCSLWIHPTTAGELKIKTGDNIRIVNDLGSEEGTALVTPGIRPDTVFAYMGFGSKNKELKRAYNRGIHCGHLLPDV
ncbi:MAG: thiosulfate reductase PhsA, partial [Desulfobacterales bacterium]|nr:thiosulfate reductase PhsA [Desulfobacterales bacterium]